MLKVENMFIFLCEFGLAVYFPPPPCDMGDTCMNTSMHNVGGLFTLAETSSSFKS